VSERWVVYLLRCADDTLYCGVTNDVARRLAQHESGRGARYTRGRAPLTLLHVERARGRGDALSREAAWKRLPRAEKLARIATAAKTSQRGATGGKARKRSTGTGQPGARRAASSR
jgi:putative endonuclease